MAVLHAAADASHTFTGWSGACTGAGDCLVRMDGDRSVVAAFVANVTLTLVTRGDGGGTGSVDSTPAGASCAATPCSTKVTLPAGTQVSLTASPGPNSAFHWSGACFGADTTCSFVLTGNVTVVAMFSEPNYVFVSSTTFPSNTLTAAVADSACGHDAAIAGLPGTYVAWLSTPVADAISRIPSGARGWIRTDGKPFADTFSDLTTKNRVFFPILLDAQGAPVMAGVHTGTTPSGVRNSGGDCNGWIDGDGVEAEDVGITTGGPADWTDIGGGVCGTYPVYCFGVDRSARVVPVAAKGRMGFVTKTPFLSGPGIAGADALCTSEASSAGLPGNYRALLATTGASPISKFDTTGQPWVRPDGIPIVTNASDLGTDSQMLAPIAVEADGTYSIESFAWTGLYSRLTVAGTADSTCQDWMSTTTLALGGSFGMVGDVSPSAFLAGSRACAASQPIYCLQE